MLHLQPLFWCAILMMDEKTLFTLYLNKIRIFYVSSAAMKITKMTTNNKIRFQTSSTNILIWRFYNETLEKKKIIVISFRDPHFWLSFDEYLRDFIQYLKITYACLLCCICRFYLNVRFIPEVPALCDKMLARRK